MQRLLILLTVVLSAFIGAVSGALLTIRYFENQPSYRSIQERQLLTFAGNGKDSLRRGSAPPYFETAARLATPAVVHIKTVYGSGSFSINPLENYFHPQARASGSGVIISDDGYIVTNYHVIEDATNIEVELNDNEHFFAKVIGKDPSTDLALLKIKARNLPFVVYGNSDALAPGEWVLAVGNPFNLNSTVTAGIVSAKARNIDILRDRNNLQVESFIQTDAAVNPGNSGGALVNLKGELIGINSAIATATGSYQGYSFAIPVSLVRKVMDDLLEFGQVQRGVLGIQIEDVNAELAEDLHLDVYRGILVRRINEHSAAEQSGLLEGDVITGIDGQSVGNVSELQELVARHRPGHLVKVTYRRSGVEKSVDARLKNYDGLESMSRKEVQYTIEGATLEELPYTELVKLSIDGGVLVRHLTTGKWKQAGMKEGFIITHIDKVNVDNVTDLNRILEYKSGGMLVEGKYRNGDKSVYGVNW
ncbi:MAG: trypsin-like peptidase domain-containing protein [Bacteroidetes bacterium]|nr:trypsin-like peptidase domain-containing protein [Bacteroidota bacterium]